MGKLFTSLISLGSKLFTHEINIERKIVFLRLILTLFLTETDHIQIQIQPVCNHPNAMMFVSVLSKPLGIWFSFR